MSVKSIKYLNAQVPKKLCFFDPWRSLLKLNFCFYVVNLEIDSVKKYIHKRKKNY